MREIYGRAANRLGFGAETLSAPGEPPGVGPEEMTAAAKARPMGGGEERWEPNDVVYIPRTPPPMPPLAPLPPPPPPPQAPGAAPSAPTPAPEQEEHVASELGEETAALKECRKARAEKEESGAEGASKSKCAAP